MVPTGGNLGCQLILSTEGAPGSLSGLLTYDTLPVAAMTSSEFVDFGITFTPTAEQVAQYGGQKLMIALCGFSGGDAGRIAFDNVRVNAVPEPGMLALLASGVFGMMAYAWRRRK
jgi:hypothetical protein